MRSREVQHTCGAGAPRRRSSDTCFALAALALGGAGGAPAFPANTTCMNTIALVLGGADLVDLPGTNVTVQEPTNAVERFTSDPSYEDTGVGRWSPGASLPSPRTEVAAASIQLANGDAFVFAAGGTGADGDNISYTSFLQFSVARNQWASLTPLPEGRADAGAAAVVVDGEFYIFVVGGSVPGAEGCPSADTLVYSVSSRGWAREAALPTPRIGLAVTAVRRDVRTDDWLVYAAGGRGCDGDASALVDRWLVLERRWETVKPLPTARAWLGLVAAEVDEEKWVVFAIGGDIAEGAPIAAVERLDVTASADADWTTLGDAPDARSGFAAVGMKNGDGEWTVHVIGGSYAGDVLATTTSVYSVTNGNWSVRPGLPTPRTNPAAATFCFSATEPASSDDEYDDDLEIILGVVGGVVFLVLVVATIRLARADTKPKRGRFQDARYRTFPDDVSGPNTRV